MNNKRNGFIILENLIALSIIVLMSSLVVSAFSTSFFCMQKSKDNLEMLNIAKKEINKLQIYIDNNEDNEKIEIDENKEMKKYNVESSISKYIDYYNCYKMKVIVKSNDNEVKLESYKVIN